MIWMDQSGGEIIHTPHLSEFMGKTASWGYWVHLLTYWTDFGEKMGQLFGQFGLSAIREEIYTLQQFENELKYSMIWINCETSGIHTTISLSMMINFEPNDISQSALTTFIWNMIFSQHFWQISHLIWKVSSMSELKGLLLAFRKYLLSINHCTRTVHTQEFCRV